MIAICRLKSKTFILPAVQIHYVISVSSLLAGLYICMLGSGAGVGESLSVLVGWLVGVDESRV